MTICTDYTLYTQIEDAMKEKSKNVGFVNSTVNPEFIKLIQLDLNSNNEYINTDSI